MAIRQSAAIDLPQRMGCLQPPDYVADRHGIGTSLDLARVWSGDTVECVATVEEVEERHGKWRYKFSFIVANQNGTTVVTGSSRGIVVSSGGDHEPVVE